jgi:hypothetical protein
MNDGSVDHDEFRVLAGPLMSALRDMMTAATASVQARHLPDVSSPCMRDLSAQGDFPIPNPADTDGPVDVCRSLSLVALAAAQSHIDAFLALVDHPTESFPWSPAVLTRAALEALGVVQHLTEANLTTRLRVGRTWNELLDNARHVERLPRQFRPSSRPARDRLDQGRQMGLTVVTEPPWV